MKSLRDRLGPRTRKFLSIVGYLFGLTLMGLAIWLAFRGGDDQALKAIKNAPVWGVGLVGGLAILNALIVAASFLVLTRSFGKVALQEMLALVGAAWLLNYLPMRPGLVGRVAYHKRYNNIHIKDSVRVLVVAGIGTVIAAAHLGALAIVHLMVGSTLLVVVAWLVSFVAVGVGSRLAFTRSVFKHFDLHRLWISLGLRYADVAIWGARYWAAALVLDVELSVVGCLLLAAASQVSFLIPVVGNGIGLREFTTGLAAGAAGLASIELGVQLELVNRTAEVLVAVPIGLASVAWLAHQTRHHRRRKKTDA